MTHVIYFCLFKSLTNWVLITVLMTTGPTLASECNIESYIRLRPGKNCCAYFSPDEVEPKCLNVNLPNKYACHHVFNFQVEHQFYFDGIFPLGSSQDNVFERIGVDAVHRVLKGYCNF